MSGDAIRDLARAVRLRDMKGAEAALDRLDREWPEVAEGRALAEKPKDPPLAPLEVDALVSIAADALASFKRKPPDEDWGREVQRQAARRLA